MSITKRNTFALLAAFSIMAVSFSAGAGEISTSAKVQQMEAAIASFGMTEAASSRAAATAIEEIARKKRLDNENTATSISQIPDDLLDISPYGL